MLDPHNQKLPLRLAYSHREKAEVAIRQCDNSLRDGGIDRDHHEKLRASYVRELHFAQRTIQRLLGVENARMESLEAQRGAALEEQLHLPERVASGKLAPNEANDTNRRLTQRIADLDEQIEVCRSRLESRTSEELGGFIDLSFPEYASADTKASTVAQFGPPPSSTRVRDWYITALLALVAAVAVFLPWFGKAGVTASLAAAGTELTQLATQAGFPAGAARLAWIFFAVVPFSSLLMSAGRNVRIIGWCYIFLGLIMLTCAAFPGLVLSAGGAGPVDAVQLVAAFRLGAALYCACAFGFIVLGAFRVSPSGDSLRHAMGVSLALLATLAAIGLLAALALISVQSVPHVTFAATLDDTSGTRILFTIANEGRDPVACYFPMPANVDEVHPSIDKSHTFGLRLAVKESGRETYSATPPSAQLWDLAQGPMPETDGVVINAGTSLKGGVDLRQLSALGIDPKSVRLEMVALDGSVVNETEVELGDRYLSKPGPIRNPLLVAPPPARPIAAPPPPSQETAPAGTKTEAADTLQVEFSGVIGDRAILHVYSADGAVSQEVVAGPGDAVGKGWVVESLVRQPSSVMLTHSGTGTSAQVLRGHVVTIAPNTKP